MERDEDIEKEEGRSALTVGLGLGWVRERQREKGGGETNMSIEEGEYGFLGLLVWRMGGDGERERET
ncbi:unnamed protein product [Prunus armeniaca]|uniref:Uncharacterized protein n=1 Tax=Prunus armeniaca TaxID=36596 RepID=A0A6J5VES4_PRUAR|nr:unnamed protein product [Prunus armeniaca]